MATIKGIVKSAETIQGIVKSAETIQGIMKSAERAQQLLARAREVRGQVDNWVPLNNAIFGIGGPLMELFPTEADRVAFFKTQEAEQIQAMIAELRTEKGDPPTISELAAKANGAISVRMPKSVHAALLAEAEAEGISLNQLCLAKLCVQLGAKLG